jgi:hypothetical protein
LPQLAAASVEEFRSVIRQLRALQPGSELQLIRSHSVTTIYCVSAVCYAIVGQINGHIQDAPIMHLFDPATLESLLHASGPQTADWEQGRLSQSWEQAIAA